jgi:hypothetical protein
MIIEVEVLWEGTAKKVKPLGGDQPETVEGMRDRRMGLRPCGSLVPPLLSKVSASLWDAPTSILPGLKWPLVCTRRSLLRRGPGVLPKLGGD